MATRTIPTCSRRLGRGTCRNEATAMVNGEPRCFDHTPRASDKYDVMPLHGTEAPEALPKCQCGCGLNVTRKRSTFRQGHDMKLRSALLRRVREMADAEAAALLVKRGWKGQSDMDAELEVAIERTGMIVNGIEDDEEAA